MSIRINWPQIISQFGSSYDEPFLFILPNAGRQLLLSIAPRLTWEASYRVEGYDFSDFDGLQAIVAQTEQGLMTGVSMDELIEALNAGFASVATAIENQEVPTFECPDISLVACNSLNNGGFPDDPPTDFPEDPIDPSDTPEPTTPTYDEYKCRATHKYLDACRYLIDNFSELVHQASPYDWLVDLLTTEEFGSPIYSVLIAIYNFLTANSYGSLKDEMLAAFDLIRDDLMCIIYLADSPAIAVPAIRDKIDALSFNFVVRYLLKLVIVESTSVEPIWVEDQIDITGYESVTCTCSGDTFDLTEDFSSPFWEFNNINKLVGETWRANTSEGASTPNFIYLTKGELLTQVSLPDGNVLLTAVHFRVDGIDTDATGKDLVVEQRNQDLSWSEIYRADMDTLAVETTYQISPNPGQISFNGIEPLLRFTAEKDGGTVLGGVYIDDIRVIGERLEPQ